MKRQLLFFVALLLSAALLYTAWPRKMDIGSNVANVTEFTNAVPLDGVILGNRPPVLADPSVHNR